VRSSLIVLALLALSPGTLAAQDALKDVRVTGAAARLRALSNAEHIASNRELRGELIAVRHDSVWVRLGDERDFTGVAARDLARVRVERHRYGARFALRWALIGWAATSAGLTVACVQEADGCFAVPIAMVVPWGLALAIAAPTMEASRWLDVSPYSLPEARAYARFPQGLPQALPRTADAASVESPANDEPVPEER
jgi:hypothetical protein